MTKTLLRRIFLLTATLAVIVIVCYGAALAYLAYESRRASRMLQELASVNIGDNQASAVPLLQKYGGFRSAPQFRSRLDDFDYQYYSEFDPLLLNQAAHPSKFASVIRMAATRIYPRLRRAMGLRRWHVLGFISVKQGRVKDVTGSVLVEGRHETLGGIWHHVETIPADEIELFVTRPGIDWPQMNRYLIGWRRLFRDFDFPGEAAEIWITPSATPDEKRSAHQFMFQCLTSRSGCRTVCDLVPAGVEYANSRPALKEQNGTCVVSQLDSW
jgi:hypothetical protein